MHQSDLTLNAIDMSCDKELIAIGGNDGKVHIYNCNNPEIEPDFLKTLVAGPGTDLPAHQKRIFALHFDR